MRADLMALTPEAVAALSNLGLVKRALREIEQGKGPKLVEEADGTVVGTFEDGVVARLIAGRLLRECPCTCTAAGVCRHRVATALAYASSGDVTLPRAAPTWSPATFSELDVERALGRRTLDEAKGAARRGVLVEVVRGSAHEVPTARLPTCTVRFLVPNDLVYARCDCAVGQRCAHVALATWAFQRAEVIDASASTLDVEVKIGAERATADESPAAAALALVEDVVADGVANAREALAQRFVLARYPLERDGQRWLVTALEDLEVALARYRARSARYRTADVVGLVAEIVARTRASHASAAALPASAVLGRGEAMETKLDHVRLVGLGCRFESDGDERSVEILLADPDTATVLVMEKSWRFPIGEAIPDAPVLARRKLGPASVSALASGQLVTRVAKRRANRVLVLGTGAGSSSVTPQTGDFASLPRPLRIDRIAELDSLMAARPPKMLRPRVLAQGMHAIAIGAVEQVVFDPGEQRLSAQLRDPDGAPFVVRRGHRKVAPGALDELARALLGQHGVPRWVVGDVTREHDGFVVDPTLVAADRVIVPDVEDGGTIELPRGRMRSAENRVDAAIGMAEVLVEEIVQLGLAGITSTYEARSSKCVAKLGELGLVSLATRMARVETALRVARAEPTDEARRAAARSVLDAAIRLALCRELSALDATAEA